MDGRTPFPVFQVDGSPLPEVNPFRATVVTLSGRSVRLKSQSALPATDGLVWWRARAPIALGAIVIRRFGSIASTFPSCPCTAT